MTTSKSERTPQDADKFIVRLPPGLRDALKARATGNNRSMNAEIVAILGAATGDVSSLGGMPVEALLREAAERLGATVEIHVTSDAPSAPGAAKRKSARPAK